MTKWNYQELKSTFTGHKGSLFTTVFGDGSHTISLYLYLKPKRYRMVNKPEYEWTLFYSTNQLSDERIKVDIVDINLNPGLHENEVKEMAILEVRDILYEQYCELDNEVSSWKKKFRNNIDHDDRDIHTSIKK